LTEPAVAEAIHATRGLGSAAKYVQAKTKQKCFDRLGFIRPNRDFSKGYGDCGRTASASSAEGGAWVTTASGTPFWLFFLPRSIRRP
jgi:hypothetical protein